MLSALVWFAGIGALLGLGLGLVSRRVRPDPSGIVERIQGCLPQIQCAQCGYPGCRPYAEALARDEAPIDGCPPGGRVTRDALVALLGRPATGSVPAAGGEPEPKVALIDEEECIGCTACLDACPVDAIVGASRHMHTVLARECTGCELCVVPCPVDCIAMVAPPAWSGR